MSIEAMKQALEALECLFGIPEQFTGKGGGDVAVWTLGGSYRAQQAIPVLRQAIEQAEKQEPVVWMYQDKSTHEVRFQKHMRSFVDHGATYETPLYTTPQPQRELNCVCGAVWEGDEMVCVPHKREWVGLTDEEIEIVSGDYTESEGFKHGARWALDQLKEKNT
jgi:hypothetical protein